MKCYFITVFAIILMTVSLQATGITNNPPCQFDENEISFTVRFCVSDTFVLDNADVNNFIEFSGTHWLFSVTATDYPTLSAPFAGAYTNYPVNVNGQDINLNTDFVDGPYVALGNIHPIHDGDVNNDGNYELQGIQVGGNSGVFNVANNNFVIEETNNSALIGVGYTAWFNLATYNGELYQRTALNGSHFTIHLENIDLVGGDADGKSYEIVMTLNTMPEPSSIALFGIAIAGMFLRKRRKK